MFLSIKRNYVNVTDLLLKIVTNNTTLQITRFFSMLIKTLIINIFINCFLFPVYDIFKFINLTKKLVKLKKIINLL